MPYWSVHVNTTFFVCRAIYARADVYLLDDPLSALDPDTEHHLFNNCIRTLLENSTVILATHQIPIVQLSDHVVVIRNVSIH